MVERLSREKWDGPPGLSFSYYKWISTYANGICPSAARGAALFRARTCPVGLRQREIGIRRAIGADRSGVGTDVAYSKDSAP
jgi:hypothetical protein